MAKDFETSVVTKTTTNSDDNKKPMTMDWSQMVEDFENSQASKTTTTSSDDSSDTKNPSTEKNSGEYFESKNISRDNNNNSAESFTYANALKTVNPNHQVVSNFRRSFKVVAISISFIDIDKPKKIVLASLERFVTVDCTLTQNWNVIVRDILKEMKVTDLVITGHYAWDLFMKEKMLRDVVISTPHKLHDYSMFAEFSKFPCPSCKSKYCVLTLANEALKRYSRKVLIPIPKH